MSEEPVNTTCHLVDHDHSRLSQEPTIGHGEDTDRVYYVKELVATTSFEKPEVLIPPCDQDREVVDDAKCNEFRDESGEDGEFTYYNCSSCTGCTYLKTVTQLIADVGCKDENRILQCELEHENITANIDPDNFKDVTKHAFFKSRVPGSAKVL